MMADDIAFVEQRKADLLRMRLAQDAADQLSQGQRIGAGGQGAQYVGKGAVPAFLLDLNLECSIK